MEVFLLENPKYHKYISFLEAQEGQLEELINIAEKDAWLPSFHIHPQCGLLNDPNGLCHYNGEYHAFYQWFPFAPIHGLKHWAHVKSKDLIHWERMPVAIIPTEEYERHGAYSGNGIVKDEKVFLFYTGNVKYSDSKRNANQCLAIMNQDYSIEKVKNNPLIKGVPDGYTGHVRDPKVWKAQDNKYYMLLGAQRENLTGVFIIYQSEDAMNWNFKGELKTPLANFGYMWECPNYIRIGDKDILIFSPQGIEKNEFDYENLYNVVYTVGTLDLENLTYKLDYMKELDKGFDFYAPQVFVDENKRTLMFGWVGMPEVQYPSDKNMWAHCLTIPRELILENNTLKQRPVEELKNLRKNLSRFYGTLEDCCLDINNSINNYELDIKLGKIRGGFISFKLLQSETEEFSINFDIDKNIVYINRESFENSFAEEFGQVRTSEMSIGEELNLNIFVDNSVIEIFINEGEVTFTSRVFPLIDSTKIQLSCKGSFYYEINKYDLDKGI